jgi:hypothetical protein
MDESTMEGAQDFVDEHSRDKVDALESLEDMIAEYLRGEISRRMLKTRFEAYCDMRDM